MEGVGLLIEFDVVSYMMGAAGGADKIPLIPESEWSVMTVEEKNRYGLVAVQNANTGLYRGYVVDGASYLPSPTLLHSASMNGASSSGLSYTAEAAGTVTMLVAAVNYTEGKDIANIKISHGSVDITADFLLCAEFSNQIRFYGSTVAVDVGDTISVENTQNVQNSGVQLFILTNVRTADVSAVGIAGNNNSTFTIPQSVSAWYVQAAKYGYYQQNNTVPTFSIFQCLESAGTSTPCPNGSTYWYGGTYVIRVQP